MELLGMKTEKSEMKNILGGNNSRWDTAEGKISKLEHTRIEAAQNEQQRKKWRSICELGDNSKKHYLCATEASEREEKAKNYLKK